MSRANVRTFNETRWKPMEFPLYSQPKVLANPLSDVKDAPQDTKPPFDVSYFYENHAGLVEVALYRILTQLFDLQSLASTHLAYTSYYIREQENSNLIYDIWVNMPPLSTEKVVMQARDMGNGEPLAMLNPLPEE